MAKAEAEAGARAAGATAAEEEMQKLLGEQRSSSEAAFIKVSQSVSQYASTRRKG